MMGVREGGSQKAENPVDNIDEYANQRIELVPDVTHTVESPVLI